MLLTRCRDVLYNYILGRFPLRSSKTGRKMISEDKHNTLETIDNFFHTCITRILNHKIEDTDTATPWKRLRIRRWNFPRTQCKLYTYGAMVQELNLELLYFGSVVFLGEGHRYVTSTTFTRWQVGAVISFVFRKKLIIIRHRSPPCF